MNAVPMVVVVDNDAVGSADVETTASEPVTVLGADEDAAPDETAGTTPTIGHAATTTPPPLAAPGWEVRVSGTTTESVELAVKLLQGAAQAATLESASQSHRATRRQQSQIDGSRQVTVNALRALESDIKRHFVLLVVY